MPEVIPEKPSVSASYRQGFKLCFSHLWLWLVPLVVYLLGYVAVLASLFSATMYHIAKSGLLDLPNKMTLDGLPLQSRLASAWQAVNTWTVFAESIRTLFTADLVTYGGFLALAILALIFYHGLETLFGTHNQLRAYYKYVVGLLALCLGALAFSFFMDMPNLFRIVFAFCLLAWSFLLAAFFAIALLVYLGYLRDRIRQEPSEVTALFLRSGMSFAPTFALIILMGVAGGAAARLITNANSITTLVFGRTTTGALFAAQAPWQVLTISSAVLAALCLFAAILLALHPTNHISLALQKTVATTLLRVDGWLIFLLTGTLTEALLLLLRQLCLALPVYWLWYDTLIQMFFGGLDILFLAWFTAALMIWLDEARSPLPKRIVVRLSSLNPSAAVAEDMLNPIELTEEVQQDTSHFEYLERELNSAEDYPPPPENFAALPPQELDRLPFEIPPSESAPAFILAEEPKPLAELSPSRVIAIHPEQSRRSEASAGGGSSFGGKQSPDFSQLPNVQNEKLVIVGERPAEIVYPIRNTPPPDSNRGGVVTISNGISKAVEPFVPPATRVVEKPVPEVIPDVPVTPVSKSQAPETIVPPASSELPNSHLSHPERPVVSTVEPSEGSLGHKENETSEILRSAQNDDSRVAPARFMVSAVEPSRGVDDAVQAIWDRNARVELDKAWETSWTRRIFIAVVTYIVALAWLLLIHEPLASLKAIVPVAGYILSTLSLPPLKYLWIRWRTRRTCPECGQKMKE